MTLKSRNSFNNPEFSILGIKNRHLIFDENNKTFNDVIKNETPTLTCHWDGKLVPNTTNNGNEEIVVDRVPVVVTGENVEKTLGVPKLANGSLIITFSNDL